MTYRERREARAARRRTWADSREVKAEAALRTAHEAVPGIPFGQPILAGHHSEGRHRRSIERSNNADRRYIEHEDMRRRHVSAADTIEQQLRSSIYSDDPDAIEQLEERIAGLEAKRDAIKAANAAFRKEHAAELKAITSRYERDRAMPHRAYELTNLGGNLNRQRKRLEELRREGESQ